MRPNVEMRLLSRTELSVALAFNFLGGEKEISFRLFGLEWNSRWKTLSIYEKFEQLIVSILTWIIAVIVAVATWQLILPRVPNEGAARLLLLLELFAVETAPQLTHLYRPVGVNADKVIFQPDIFP